METVFLSGCMLATNTPTDSIQSQPRHLERCWWTGVYSNQTYHRPARFDYRGVDAAALDANADQDDIGRQAHGQDVRMQFAQQPYSNPKIQVITVAVGRKGTTTKQFIIPTERRSDKRTAASSTTRNICSRLEEEANSGDDDDERDEAGGGGGHGGDTAAIENWLPLPACVGTLLIR